MTARHLWQLEQGESRETIANKMEKWSKQTKAKKKNQIFFCCFYYEISNGVSSLKVAMTVLKEHH